MTNKEEVKGIAFKTMFKHGLAAIICFCADAYLSSMPWATIALWAVASVCLTTFGFVAGVIRTTEKLTK